eukprot:3243335-Rhodomonas_salina.1
MEQVVTRLCRSGADVAEDGTDVGRECLWLVAPVLTQQMTVSQSGYGWCSIAVVTQPERALSSVSELQAEHTANKLMHPAPEGGGGGGGDGGGEAVKAMTKELSGIETKMRGEVERAKGALSAEVKAVQEALESKVGAANSEARAADQQRTAEIAELKEAMGAMKQEVRTRARALRRGGWCLRKEGLGPGERGCGERGGRVEGRGERAGREEQGRGRGGEGVAAQSDGRAGQPHQRRHRDPAGGSFALRFLPPRMRCAMC